MERSYKSSRPRLAALRGTCTTRLSQHSASLLRFRPTPLSRNSGLTEWTQVALAFAYLSAIVLVSVALLSYNVAAFNVSSIVTDVTSDVSSLSPGEELADDFFPLRI